LFFTLNGLNFSDYLGQLLSFSHYLDRAGAKVARPDIVSENFR
jgi:hypothetical protein